MRRHGMTLIELLIGVTLSGVIFLGASSLAAVFFSSNERTRQMSEMDQAQNDIFQDITNSVRWASSVSIEEGKVVVVPFDRPDDVITYELVDNEIRKNGNSMMPTGIQADQFEIADRSLISILKSLEIKIGLTHKKFANLKDNFSIVVSQRLTSYAY